MELDDCKEKITANLQRDIDVSQASEEDLEHLVGPKEITSLRLAIREVGNPRKTLFMIHKISKSTLFSLETIRICTEKGISHSFSTDGRTYFSGRADCSTRRNA
jgi:hypothetical protein